MDIKEYKNMFLNESSYWWYVGLHHLVSSFVRIEQDKNMNLRLLDAGCGTGGMLSKLSFCKNKTGFDYSRDAINFCKERGLNYCFVQDINTWTTVDNYDVIISLDVLYHSEVIDDVKVMKSFYSALNPGGILILNLPAFNILKRKHDEVVHTSRRYLKSEVNNILCQIGFTIEISTYRIPILFIYLFFQKFTEKFKKEVHSDLSTLPTRINNFLIKMIKLENKLILKKVSFPIGSSIFVIARKV